MNKLKIKWETQYGLSSKKIVDYLVNDHDRDNNIKIIKDHGTTLIIKTSNSSKGLEKELERVFEVSFWVNEVN